MGGKKLMHSKEKNFYKGFQVYEIQEKIMNEDIENKLKKTKDQYFYNLFKQLIEFIAKKDSFKNLKWFQPD